MENNVRVHLYVYGRVQGVFFRATTQQTAIKLGLTGWVKNRPDGSVEVVAEGNENDVHALISWCHHGPDLALVQKVDIMWENYQGAFERFFVA